MTKANEIKILIAEDDNELRESIVKLFQIFGFHVTSAKDGAEAYESVKAQAPDIVLTDVRMPNKGGVELIKKLRAETHDKPKIFVISGFTDFSTAELLDIGADGFFPKPFDASAVRRTLTNALLDPAQRWSKPSRIFTTHEVIKKIKNLIEAEKSHDFTIGRGGFFVRTKYEKPKAGDFVKFRIDISDGEPHTKIEGIGQVIWSRDQAESLAPEGIGVEFKQLDEYCLQKLLLWYERKKIIPYIPKG